MGQKLYINIKQATVELQDSEEKVNKTIQFLQALNRYKHLFFII